MSDIITNPISEPQAAENQNGSILLYKVGEQIEVTSEDPGFGGAWYAATVLESEFRDSDTDSKKISVKYHNLLNDLESGPLCEIVNLSSVRPLPPITCGSNFEVNDVVDAWFNDGWWPGIVKKTLGESKYRVFFSNPADVIDFCGRDLRFHQDWAGSKWIFPQKKRTTVCAFSEGDDVEVCIDNEIIRNSWIPAIIIQRQNNAVLVKYHNPQSDVGNNSFAYASVEPARVRLPDTSSSELLNESDINGEKIAEGDNSIFVQFPQGGKDVYSTLSSLGPCCQHKNGSSESTKEAPLSPNINKSRRIKTVPRKPSLKCNYFGRIKGSASRQPPCGMSVSASKRSKQTISSPGHADSETPSKRIGGSAVQDSTSGNGFRGRKANGSTSSGRRRVGSYQTKKRGRPPNPFTVDCEMGSSEEDHDGVAATCSPFTGDTVASLATMCVSSPDVLTNGGRGVLPEKSGNNGNGEGESHRTTPDDATSNGHDFSVPRKCPLWETVESLEAFKIMPQRPHFLPLSKSPETLREGSAIGLMVTFATLFDRVSTLQFDDPRSTFIDILHGIFDLECHGFDCVRLRRRIDNLVAIIDTKKEMQDRLESLLADMVGSTGRHERLRDQRGDIERMIVELQKQLSETDREIEAETAVSQKLNAGIESITKSMDSSRADFKVVQNAPWLPK